MSIGIPYMGSKRALAKPILDFIIRHNPNVKYFYDLFGGGGAVSFEALTRKCIEQVHYNEIDTAIVSLLEKIKTTGVTPEFYRWVSREDFMKYKDDKTWFGGVVSTCWSFGNNKKNGYLFSAKNEQLKRPLHEIIVNKCEKARQEFFDMTGIFIDDSLLTKSEIQARRLDVVRYIKKQQKTRIDLEQLERLQHLERIQQLERLTQIDRLFITNLSYELVKIDTPVENTVIYLDPPYSGKSKYTHDIDHDAFIKWVKASPYTIYVSSYDIPELYECVQFKHRVTLSPTAKSKVTEKLFCNKPM